MRGTSTTTLDVSPGTVIDQKFRVERVLGEGGMGIVVRAINLGLGTPVALKLLLPKTLADPVLAARFIREARTVARLQSDYVARVLDVGSLKNGGPYIVMEYLDGETFSESLKRRGPFPIADACGYFLQVCDALAEAHANGIVHRDLKLSNLFLALRPNGKIVAKVLDFGISKLSADDGSDDPELTLTSSFLGTPRYMAPEQLISSREVDARADIWSCGVCLHGILCGSTPFDGDSVASVTARVLNTDPPDLRSRRAEIPAELAAVVRRCLMRRPAERWQSAGELATALLPWAAPVPGSFPNLAQGHAPPQTILGLGDPAVESARLDATRVDGERNEVAVEVLADATRVDARPALARTRPISPPHFGQVPQVPGSSPSAMDSVLPAPPLSALPFSAFSQQQAIEPERTGGFGRTHTTTPPTKRGSLAVVVLAGMLVGAALFAGIRLSMTSAAPELAPTAPAIRANTDTPPSATPVPPSAPVSDPSPPVAQTPPSAASPTSVSPADWPAAPTTPTSHTTTTATVTPVAPTPTPRAAGGSKGTRKSSSSSGGIPDER